MDSKNDVAWLAETHKAFFGLFAVIIPTWLVYRAVHDSTSRAGTWRR